MTTLAPPTLAERVTAAQRELAVVAPQLGTAFADALPRATDLVARRLAGAVYRENIRGARGGGWRGGSLELSTMDGHRLAVPATRHGFDRVEPLPLDDPEGVLVGLAPAGGGLVDELADAVVHLALGYARRGGWRASHAAAARRAGVADAVGLAGTLAPDDQVVFFESLAVEGHNLHPCGRTRLGWSIADALAHDLETPRTGVRFLAVRADRHVGDDLGALLGFAPRPGYVVQPVHAWQFGVLSRRYPQLFADGSLVRLDEEFAAAPTAALRTVLLPPRPRLPRQYLKLSLDIQVTSARRTISVASCRNGPVVSRLLSRLLADDPAADRLLLLGEPAGAATVTGAGGDRDATAILRDGLDERLAPGEVVVPACALAADSTLTRHTVLAELMTRFAATRQFAAPAEAARAFVLEYSRLLLPPLLALSSRYGIALEAHLQNCLPTFVDGVPHRLALRDFAGMRVLVPRLRARGLRLPLWPGSVIGTDDADVMRAKLAYTALQAHLGEVVLRLVASHGLDEPAAWRQIRGVLDEVYDELGADPQARADHAFLTAPTVPHKALVRMRLATDGDLYVPVANPLARTAW